MLFKRADDKSKRLQLLKDLQASPLAQSERHARVLGKLLERLGITGRLGTQPKFHHLVMFHSKAIIRLPAVAHKFNTSFRPSLCAS